MEEDLLASPPPVCRRKPVAADHHLPHPRLTGEGHCCLAGSRNGGLQGVGGAWDGLKTEEGEGRKSMVKTTPSSEGTRRGVNAQRLREEGDLFCGS